jgi:hypothetical protein
LFYAILCVRSPSLIGGVGGFAALIVSQYLASLRRNHDSVGVVTLRLSAMVVGFLIVFGFMLFLYQDRIHRALTGADSSTMLRFIVPTFLAYETLLSKPLFGYGMGARHTIGTMIYNVLVYFHLAGLSKFLNPSAIGAAMGNSFCEMVISIGVVGTFGVYVCLHKMREQLGTVPWLFYFPTVFVFLYLIGGLATLIPWAVAILLLGPTRELPSGAAANAHPSGEGTPTSNALPNSA